MTMKLKRVIARNFGSYQNVEIDFDKLSDLTVIVGYNHDEPDGSSNGAGKSTLTDIVPFLLFNRSIEDRQLGDLVNDDVGKKMLVEGWFENGIKITRGRKPNKFTIEDTRLPEGQQDITSMKSQQWLEEQYGIDWETFRFIYRFGGGETGLVSYAKCSEDFRRKVQDALLQAPRVTACLKAARAMRNELVKKLDILTSKADHMRSEISVEEDEVEDIQERLEKGKQDIQSKIDELEDYLEKFAKFDVEEAYRTASKFEEIVSQLSNLKNDLDSYRDQKRDVENEFESLEKKIVQTSNDLKRWKSEDEIDAKQLREDLGELSRKLVALESENEKIKEVADEVAQIESDMEEIDGEIEELKKIVQEYRDVKKNSPGDNLEQLEENLSNKQEKKNYIEQVLDRAKDDLQKERERFESFGASPQLEIDKLKSEYHGIRFDIARHQDRIAEIRQSIDQIGNMEKGTTCPTCYGKVDPKNAESVIVKLEEEIDSLESKIEKLDGRLVEIDESKSQLKDRLDEYESCRSQIQSEEESISDLKRDIEEIEKSIDEAKSLISRFKDIEKMRSSASKAKSSIVKLEAKKEKMQSRLSKMNKGVNLNDQISSIRSQIKSVEDSIEKAEDHNARRIEKISSLQSSLEKDQELLESIGTKVDNLARKEELCENKIRDCEKEKESLNRPNGKPPRTKDQIKALEEQAEDARKSIEDKKLQLENHPLLKVLQDTIKKKSDREALLRDTQTEIDSIDAKKPYIDFWIEAFDSEGIRSLAMKDLIEILNTQASHYMEVISGSPVSFQFSNELVPELTRQDTGEPFVYRKCSGGQKKRVNIAIAMAFLDTIRMAAGCDLNLFIVDEAADALDTLGMHGFSDALSEFANERKIFVISHNPTLVDTLIGEGHGVLNVHYRNGESWIEQN